jgi:hypothetical protein
MRCLPRRLRLLHNPLEYRVLANQGEARDEIHEFQLAENPPSRLVTLGMTLEELDALLAELAS